MQPGQVKKVMIQIAEGLDHAHQRGVFHRDIKPANILLNAKGEPVIVDFGIARLPKMQTISTKKDILGTPSFLSPEQIEGVDIDGRSDLYSLGILGYELLTGTVPFKGRTFDVIMAHLRKQPTPLREINPSIPEGYEGVILKLLAKKPEERYQSAGELIQALEAL
jgi:serine/threonine-protein kinase